MVTFFAGDPARGPASVLRARQVRRRASSGGHRAGLGHRRGRVQPAGSRGGRRRRLPVPSSRRSPRASAQGRTPPTPPPPPPVADQPHLEQGILNLPGHGPQRGNGLTFATHRPNLSRGCFAKTSNCQNAPLQMPKRPPLQMACLPSPLEQMNQALHVLLMARFEW